MEKSIPICESDNAMLKQKTLPYLPRNLGEMEAHRQILNAIATVVPEVSACIDIAEISIWPKVKSQEIPVNRAIAQCAYEANNVIGSAALDMNLLRSLPEETLMETWIGLDYYGYVLKADYAVNIRNLQNHIADILLHPQPIVPEDIPVSVLPTDIFDTPIIHADPIEPTAPIDPIEPTAPIDSIEPTAPIDPIIHADPIEPTVPVIPIIHADPIVPDPVTAFTKPPKKTGGIIAIVAAVLVVAITAAALVLFVFNDVRKTELAINGLGTISLDSGDAIENAENLYAELDADQQAKVENIDTLLASRAEYDALVTDDAIGKIGTVTLNSLKAIEQAEGLYDALSRDARNLVKNYKTLSSARKEYTRLENAVKKASDAIDAIGTVTLNSEKAIKDARSAYDALKKDNLEGQLASKLSILTDAEKEYDHLFYQDIYDTGLSNFESGNFQDAIDCFDKIILNYSDPTLLKNSKDAKANSQIELARAAYVKKDYYTATVTLRQVDSAYHSLATYQEQSEQLQKALQKNRPSNSASIAGKLAWGQCYFKITAADKDVCIKFENKNDPTKFKLVYIRAGQSIKLNVEDGTYAIKWATGDYWYGKDHMFGPDTVYKYEGSVSFTTTRSGSWIYYRYLDLDLAEDPNAATIISESEF